VTSEITGSRLEGSTLIVDTAEGSETYDSKFLVATILITVARANGQIEQEESSLIIDLIEEHFHLQGAESLELITRALEETADKPSLVNLLTDLAPTLPEREKEEIAFMGLKVVAADGRRDVSEMEQYNVTMSSLGISPDIVHRAFDRYFEQTMPGK
jgi:uncharacterized tellurite resistance protein B-like protein